MILKIYNIWYNSSREVKAFFMNNQEILNKIKSMSIQEQRNLSYEELINMLLWICQRNLHKIKREYLTLPSWVLAHIYGKALNLC